MKKEERPSKKLIGFIFILFVTNVFLLIAIITPNGHYSLSRVKQVVDEQSATAPVFANEAEPMLRLEWRIVERYEEDEWDVEKYRQYEVYIDDENNIVDEIPTNQYNYLKYWRY